MSVAVEAVRLGKEYRLGGEVRRRSSIYDVVSGWLDRTRSNGEHRPDDRFWALREVAFAIARGEVAGVVGPNGAGKSTLLKILSRITAPTEGRALLRGTLASLLEVGTGFHPELTGRENVFLNGAILGMRRKDIVRRFDDIVSFAEIEKFLDTPVKRYSSGMYVRLAFAVAAHLESDILVVDEVLAVGDAAFQRKCLGKMSDVASAGRAVLFVSHNMSAITRLCRRGLLLRRGRLVLDGDVTEVVNAYLDEDVGGVGVWCRGDEDRYESLLSARILNAAGQPASVVAFDAPCHVEIRYAVPGPDDGFVVALRVMNALGIDVFGSSDTDPSAATSQGQIERGVPIGEEAVARCTIPARLLKPGPYVVTPMVIHARHSRLEKIESGRLSFEVSQVGYHFETTRWGVLTPLLEWRSEPAGAGEPAAASLERDGVDA